jgi:drug/metabolite transporter (DMT)-like permease
VVAPASSRFTADGTNQGNFGQADWGLLLLTALIWGSSFLWIAIGLDAFHPGVIAFGRMALGAAVLWMFPASRRPVPRAAWPAILLVAVVGNSAPAVFFPLAQQRVESSVAGMLNSGSPIIVLLIAVLITRKLPLRPQLIGLAVGLVGAVFLAVPNLAGSDAEPVGILLVFCAITGYGVSNNFLPPLVQAYGGPAVIARAMLASAILLAPWGSWAVTQSEFAWKSAIALFVLGVFGTGLARTTFAMLSGRVGAPRSSIISYLVPVVAIVLGVTVRGESVGMIELLGTALILVSAALISRGRQS